MNLMKCYARVDQCRSRSLGGFWLKYKTNIKIVYKYLKSIEDLKDTTRWCFGDYARNIPEPIQHTFKTKMQALRVATIQSSKIIKLNKQMSFIIFYGKGYYSCQHTISLILSVS